MGWIQWTLTTLGGLIVAGALVEAACAARDRGRYKPPGRMVDVGGRRLHVLCKGDAPGPTVVIEQGAGSPSILWWPIQNKVSAFARVCTYDRAGYLWSDPVARVRSLEARVADLHALLHGANIPAPYVLAGHSFGGLVIRLYARTYPEQVAGMVLVDTPEEAVILRPSYGKYVGQMGVFARLLEGVSRIGVVRLLAGIFMRDVPEGLTPDSFQAMKSMIVRPAFFRAMGDDPVALSRAPETLRALGGAGTFGNRPLVVITHGLKFPGPAAVLEEGWRDGQARLAALSTRGGLVVAEKSNHMVHSDQPDVVIDAIRRVVEASK